MFPNILQFLKKSLIPNKSMLRLRLAPLHAYMGATLAFTIVVTIFDWIVLRPDFFLPMWLFLHGFAIFFFYLLWVALLAFIVQLVTRIRTKQAWTYRQAWPYAVASSLIPTSVIIMTYQLAPTYLMLPFLLLAIYLIYPLLRIPQKNSRPSR